MADSYDFCFHIRDKASLWRDGSHREQFRSQPGSRERAALALQVLTRYRGPARAEETLTDSDARLWYPGPPQPIPARCGPRPSSRSTVIRSRDRSCARLV